MLAVLVERQTIKDFYEVEEFARLVGKAEFTVREWCRLGRINAQKAAFPAGSAFAAWVISHQELLPLSCQRRTASANIAAAREEQRA